VPYVIPNINTGVYPSPPGSISGLTGSAVRLPQVGTDNGTWGYLLNNILSTSLAVQNVNGTTASGYGFLTNVQVLGTPSFTASYTASAYPGEVILANATSGTTTITLPNATTTLNLYSVKKTDISANPVYVICFGTQTIDGGTIASLKVQFTSITVASDGANWNII